MPSDPIAIRDCATIEEYRACVELQRTVWGWKDEELIPTRLFVVAHKIEGQVIGAFETTGRLVGFCLAVPALRKSLNNDLGRDLENGLNSEKPGETVYLHSHMLAVLPEFRRARIGLRLKLEQRRQALARGIRLIEWTFDPLEWKNAIFNLNRLGAIARRYVPNHYGVSSSPLHRGFPTDRLIAEWWIDSPRVSACVENRAVPPAEPLQRIPMPIDQTPERPESSVAELQGTLRAQFQDAFARGLAATGFETRGSAGAYLLTSEPPFRRTDRGPRISV